MSILNIVTALKDIKENIAGLDESTRQTLGVEPSNVDEFIQRFERAAENEVNAEEAAAIKAFGAKYLADGCPAITDAADRVLLAKFLTK